MRLSSAVSLVSASLALTSVSFVASAEEVMPICNVWKGYTYEKAKADYPDLTDSINIVQQHGFVPWYTDNSPQQGLDVIIEALQSKCPEKSKIPMVIYGLPKKDCVANYSNMGFNKNLDDYKAFLQRLNDAFPKQHMIYIVEPDAIGLTVNGGCSVDNDYKGAVKVALEMLSANPNAELYLDIGFWALLDSGKPDMLAQIVNEIWPKDGGKLKGIALNVSNYEKTEEMIALCEKFAKLTGRNGMKCIIDTSRNYRGPSATHEWCNAKGAGIGHPPTMDTGNAQAAYFLWVKTPGESDGECTNEKSGEATVGPRAGDFFKDYFQMLWQNGYFVDKKQTSPSSAPAPTTAKPTSAPAPAPVVTLGTETPAPAPAPVVTVATVAPAPVPSSGSGSFLYCGPARPDAASLTAWCNQNCPAFCPTDMCKQGSC
ncbi:hypothetical protein Poli38472_012556 [Pythium oligandrum]|uniref:Glucanase n=1 Tax=Pythium oligandrum TaxID=41045 RepID=A0A8K1FF83_PYTOL|nr:hypothetical protein Poli38472_012556 [Pythium oligandrum]|eukprot:TMW61365.1 hypothetical protein Poli38472_012556 [Pythium oligandrum]